MAISLVKATPVNVSKQAPGLNNVRAGLKWDSKKINGEEADADVSVFMLNAEGKIPSDGYFIFYNNLKSADGAVVHNGDARTGIADGDDESININLSKVSPEISFIVLTVTIANFDKGFNFGNTINLEFNLYDQNTNQKLCNFQLGEEHPEDDSVIIATFSRGEGGEWNLEANATTFGGGLESCLKIYG
jgi:tellurium resistance protein TerD